MGHGVQGRIRLHPSQIIMFLIRFFVDESPTFHVQLWELLPRPFLFGRIGLCGRLFALTTKQRVDVLIQPIS